MAADQIPEVLAAHLKRMAAKQSPATYCGIPLAQFSKEQLIAIATNLGEAALAAMNPANRRGSHGRG